MFIAESPKTDKPTRLDDAICPEKNELREEKLPLKAEKERTESLVPSSGLMAQIPAPFGEDKTAANLSDYGYMPVWHYLPRSVRDISCDQDNSCLLLKLSAASILFGNQ
ncbi:LOW QUALITY PROTEIN: hypothetical protein HID58_080223, partial [Brassica napus]